MSGTIITFINDKKVELYHGATLKHALLKMNETYYKQVISGQVEIRDHEGNLVDIHGSVDHGFRYYVTKKRA